MGEKGIKTSHEDIREKMKKQAQIFINDISTILAEALQESEKDERKYIVEIARHTAEAENFEQTLDQMIEKWETLTDSTHPVELILYRKQNPDIFKLLKLPNKLSIVMPSFSVGQINKSQNKHQFGKLITSKVNLIKSPVESSKHIQPTMSAKGNKSKKRVLERSVKTSQIKAEKRKLCYMACRDDRSAYISGDGPGIQLIDRSGTELDNISMTENQLAWL
ncbi:uncharacterized protein LOC134237440 [Saccostrea cucullata]|uniref:uncharacterized protein LOC134237440 n=1 Tax=Saccostrea cuccullata TaxID=36930 RepID=UPI002ED19061